MTCVIGLLDKGNIWMGADSAGVSGSAVTIRNDEKVFRNGQFLMGFTSSFRMGQLLRYNLDPPPKSTRMSTRRYMNTVFVDAVRSCLKDGGFATVKDNQEQAGTFLIGYKAMLFSMHSDFQIELSRDSYSAVGSGCEFAIGALYATEKTRMKPRDRLRLALDASEHGCIHIRRPFVIKCLKGKSKK